MNLRSHIDHHLTLTVTILRDIVSVTNPSVVMTPHSGHHSSVVRHHHSPGIQGIYVGHHRLFCISSVVSPDALCTADGPCVGFSGNPYSRRIVIHQNYF